MNHRHTVPSSNIILPQAKECARGMEEGGKAWRGVEDHGRDYKRVKEESRRGRKRDYN